MLELDHIAISGETLGQATDHVARTLGVTLQQGGEHDVFHTHNTLLGLEDGLYLEAIAINPEGATPTRPRWFGLDGFEGPARLTNWICRCDDLDAALAALPEGFGKPVSLVRGDLRWRIAVPTGGVMAFDNCAPALIEWESDAHPAARLTPSACRLTALNISHPDARELEGMLAPYLDDARIGFKNGPAAITASFDTADGMRILK